MLGDARESLDKVREAGERGHMLELVVAMGGLGLALGIAGSCSPMAPSTWGAPDGFSEAWWSTLTRWAEVRGCGDGLSSLR